MLANVLGVTSVVNAPLDGWAQIILQAGSFGLLAYVVVVLVPKAMKDARDEREKAAQSCREEREAAAQASRDGRERDKVENRELVNRIASSQTRMEARSVAALESVADLMSGRNTNKRKRPNVEPETEHG